MNKKKTRIPIIINLLYQPNWTQENRMTNMNMSQTVYTHITVSLVSVNKQLQKCQDSMQW